MKTNKQQAELYVGIDLGTTNSVLAYTNLRLNGDLVSNVVEIPRAVDAFNTAMGKVGLSTRQESTLPSCVYYLAEREYEPVVGNFAKTQYPLRPHLVAKSIKSQMGNSEVEGLALEVPDKTPAEVSARILKHMIDNASSRLHAKITDAVITVPASFDSAMRDATLEAARIAGITTQNADGSLRPILLSEPNAVIYDLINQIQNGVIPAHLLDVKSKKRVLVFDIGGGTLDITMHEILQDEDGIVHMDEIATNRYTRLGGDDFDRLLAETMYQRFLEKWKAYPQVQNSIENNREIVMSHLLNMAEDLKIAYSEQNNSAYGDNWDNDEDFIVGGRIPGLEYAYDDIFSEKDVEDCFEGLLAKGLNYEDYKRVNEINDTFNIIYPILDVLSKASIKLNEENIQVDSIIVNGGMSKFNLIIERLEEFFGKEPITVMNPDLSVAMGASIYHYLLRHKQVADSSMEFSEPEIKDKEENESKKEKEPAVKSSIKVAQSVILNDALYLKARNNTHKIIIPTGTALPYDSDVLTGFSIRAGQKKVMVPIAVCNLDGSYSVIADGLLNFEKDYRTDTPVCIQIHMDPSRLISIKAWTSRDSEGKEPVEIGNTNISIGRRSSIEQEKQNNKPVNPNKPENGTLHYVESPNRVVSALISRGQNLWGYGKYGQPVMKSEANAEFKARFREILSASNKEDFVEPLLEAAKKPKLSVENRQRLCVLLRRMTKVLNEDQKKRAVQFAKSVIEAGRQSNFCGPITNAVSEAINLITAAGTKEDALELCSLSGRTNLKMSLISCYGTHHVNFDWVYREFMRDVDALFDDEKCGIIMSALNMGLYLRKSDYDASHQASEHRVLETMLETVKNGYPLPHELVSLIAGIGYIADQRFDNSPLYSWEIEDARKTVEACIDWYEPETVTCCLKAREICLAMIRGEKLTQEQEDYLLDLQES